MFDDLELMCIEVSLPKQKTFMVVYWYRPPNSQNIMFDKFEALLQLLESTSKDVLIMGDLNCDFIKKPLNHQTKILKRLGEEYDLKQHVDKPTRVTPTSSTLIDVLFSSNHDKVTFCDVIPLSLSDHYMIVCSLGRVKYPKAQHKYVNSRNMRRFDVDKFKTDLRQVNWDDVLEDSDPNTAYETWAVKYNIVLNKHAPLKRKRVRQKESSWINDDILNKIRERDRMKRKAKRTKLDSDWTLYKKSRNSVTAMIRRAKRSYVSESILNNTGDSTAMWKSLRRIMPKKRNVGSIPKITVDRKEITGSKNIASCFNDYFVDLATRRKETRKFGTNMEQYNYDSR